MADLSLTYNDHQINERGEMLSLTDMWRAAGKPKSKEPFAWARLPVAVEFIDHICCNLRISQVEAIQSLRGNDSGTWAHWQIGMAYAKYLSPEFHAWCNHVVRDYMESRNAPVQTMPAVIAEPSQLEQTMARLADLVYSGMAHQTEEIAEVKTEVSALKHGQARIEARLDEIASRGRRRIKDTTKGEIVRDTERLGGRCPCCGVTSVTQDGYRLPHAEFDHFYANSSPDANHCWLICIACHAELTRHVAKRDERNAEFQAFQAKRRRLPGAQLSLLTELAA